MGESNTNPTAILKRLLPPMDGIEVKPQLIGWARIREGVDPEKATPADVEYVMGVALMAVNTKVRLPNGGYPATTLGQWDLHQLPFLELATQAKAAFGARPSILVKP